MLRLLLKIAAYGILMLLVLEGLVRLFHLYNDRPVKYATEEGLYKWIPGQQGYAVYGNRRQSFTEYRINKSGYNSYREFTPTQEAVEVALVGDSFIEGFHQDYYNSIGKKIEKKIKDIQVYEYGHSGNDFASQLFLIHTHATTFELIDHIIINIKYENDFLRSTYKFQEFKPHFSFLRNSKLAVYLLNIGITDPIKNLNQKIRNLAVRKSGSKQGYREQDNDSLYLENFINLVEKYNYDKVKMTLLLDSRTTHKNFMAYLEQNGFAYIDLAETFTNSDKVPTTLVYDHHWNDYGRTLVAEEIIGHLRKVVY